MPPFQNFTNSAKKVIRRSHELAIERGQNYVNAMHLLAALLLDEESFLFPLLEKLQIDPDFFTQKVLEEIEGGESEERRETLDSPQQMFLTTDLAQIIELSVKIASILKDKAISTEHLFLAIFELDNPARNFLLAEGVEKNRIEALLEEIREEEAKLQNHFTRKYKTLAKYSIDLTEQARERKLDPVIGREKEIARLIHILSRRTKNNPILIGEPGVGKTAIVEGLAQKVIKKEVPRSLQNLRVILLDLGSLLAGTKYRGEFEERLKRIIKEIETQDEDIVLFIDEIHTLIGAGSSEGSMDAANMLKPSLARATLKIIGSTTRDEFQKYFEKDSALVRRFQPIYVEEPSKEEAVRILKGLRSHYELFHGVRISDEAIHASVDYATRYLNERNLPDKAIDLLDEAASMVKISLEHLPEEMKNASQKIKKLEVARELLSLQQESKKTPFKKIDQRIQEIKQETHAIEKKWETEKKLLDQLAEVYQEIENAKRQADEAEQEEELGKVAEITYGRIPALEKRYHSLTQKLKRVQKKGVLLKDQVQKEDVAKVISKWTGVPLQKMLQEETTRLLQMEEILQKRVKGQNEAIRKIVDTMLRARTGINDPHRPIGSFLFLGPTGVGKTELTKALAAFMFEDENSLVRVDMSEFMEKHSVAKLIGSPPGYVGHEDAGVLTEAVRHRPYSIVLFDEIEKAHPDVFHILLQILDEGRITDNKGRMVDFKNTIIILTSNLGSGYLQKMQSIGFLEGEEKERESLKAKVMGAIHDFFRPEFLNRLDEIIIFNPLSEKDIAAIIEREIDKLKKRLEEKKISLSLQKDAIRALVEKGFNPQYGARSLKRTIEKEVTNLLARELLQQSFTEGDILSVQYDRKKDSFFLTKKMKKRTSPRKKNGAQKSHKKELVLK